MNNNHTDTWAQQHRQLRLFISSTFVDMNAERNALTRIFPQISELCRQRGVEFVPIDLRWGITEDDAKEGRVIETCLREINDSRPFFIGIIGNRYGWVPQKSDLGAFAEDLLQKYPWLDKALELQMSITEMEMQHAVLMHMNDEGMNAAFYLRSDAVDVNPAFKEIPGSAGARKLQKLKSAIRNQKQFASHDYKTVDQLADMVLRDVTAFLDRVFPTLDVASYDEIAEKQERLLKSRSKSLFPLARYQNNINQWIQSNEKRDLLITGKIGIGKSYLMADIIKQLRNRGDKLVYVDISEQENLVRTMEYIFSELLFQIGEKSRKQTEKESNIGCLFSTIWMLIKFFFIAFTIPFRAAFGKKGAAQTHFKNKLEEISQSYAANSLVTLVKKLMKALDKHPDTTLYVALDNLDDLTGDDLSIFTVFNEIDQIRIIVSASLNSNTQLYLQNRKTTEVLQVGNLYVSQATSYVNCYLSQYGKSLDARGEQCEKLMKMGVAGIPLLLSHVLELMVRFGSHEELDDYINELSTISNETELYIKMLKHIIYQFESSSHLDNIKDIITAFAVVKDGLSESEIKDIFNPKEIIWAQLRPYLFSIFRCKGKMWKPASTICRNVILNQMKDRVPVVADKIGKYFEDTLHCCSEHIDNSGSIDGMAYMKDLELLARQVQVLPELYYECDRIEDLYYWSTYIRCDMSLTDEQRYRYWKKLYAAGIHLRNSGDVDIPPYILRISKRFITGTNGKILFKDYDYLVRMVNAYYASYKWLQASKDDLNAMYTRWNSVAGFLSNADDIRWLNVKSRMTGRGINDITEANILNTLSQATVNKEWNKVIETGRSAIVDEQARVFINLYMIIAYRSKGDIQKAFDLSKTTTELLTELGLEYTPEALSIICIYAELSCQCGTMADVDKGHTLLTLHDDKDHTRNMSNNNSLLFNGAMARVNLKKGNKDAAIRYATVYAKICTSMGGTTQLADDIIAKANQIR